ncbi:MAG: hypothetical protein FD163_242 [Hyphomonadaceae bacterium]|nr:MAG: hypothetical protein FD128_190 [Hyphomonadaceae bacterium]KAF0186967.1 MAG: hypothetical protein FD163_242 [Hyphomonadaceae bacterium]
MKLDKFLSRINSDANICGGRPCIAGTRMRVTDIVEMVGGGITHEEILNDFPYLEEGDVAAAINRHA